VEPLRLWAANASYAVTVYSSDSSSAASLSITVNDQKPTALSYAAGTSAYTINVPITPNVPANSGGAVDLLFRASRPSVRPEL